MSEDAPVNIGAVRWPDPESAAITVRRMQTKLHHWAREDSSRRFDDLYNLVYDPAFLVHAWERVAGNKGAATPGIDKVTVPMVEVWVGPERYLDRIREQLESQEFQPVEVRRVLIPKASGKLRKLGIPPIADRIVQASMKLVLEPIFEADFKPCSYGFRPNRRAHDAIAEIHYFGSNPRRYEWVLEADIKACFDEIEHNALMDRLRARIKDKRVCTLVKAFLKAGVLTELGGREDTLTGTPQGGILSPLLANIALSALDDHFDRQWREDMGTEGKRRWRKKTGRANWRLIRYADDFVVMVSGQREHAEAVREQVQTVLAPLGLRLAPEKTRVVHIDEGFDFLSFTVRRRRKRGALKHYVYVTVSRKAAQAIKDKVRQATYRTSRQGMEFDELLLKLNRMLVGWANYFRHAIAKRLFSRIDYFTWHRIMRWLRRKYEGKHRLGMPEMRRRFCDKGWRFAWKGVVFTGAARVRVDRYRYRGYSIPTPWTSTPTAAPTGG
ncbi:group II intron reverse transcriptase/maturase [Acrocarpospora pleiomorpha]|uniref:Group II intron reverse transcriptase/maturase n=1 Tax=Acrocarpospora pleiomorpha TaxID=90975 RepID=A0A5M3XXU2_9ACTN|nr:group II intron reverse transcriptase/maturase [Acrocarpospora pleiomorpha]GES24263.1 group II intron reverse transcriptase/maturase [Acrocarpospora pleiomorpha]